MARLPRGYVGTNHETIGSDILAVQKALTFPEAVLGGEIVQRLATVDTNGWYPIAWLLDLMELLDTRVGAAGLQKMGRAVFTLSHEAKVRETAKSARDIVYGIDGMYRHANRGGQIGGWRVLSFEPGRATLEKTTPHHCVMEQGILERGLTVVGASSRVTQSDCFRKGKDACIFVITSDITDARWSGGA